MSKANYYIERRMEWAGKERRMEWADKPIKPINSNYNAVFNG